MSNNEERYCHHCNKETLFMWNSDRIWYCEECGKPYGSYPIMDMETQEFQDSLADYEEENGPSVYCTDCGNFHTVEEILDSCFHLCPISGDDWNNCVIGQMNQKGYVMNDTGEWKKVLYHLVKKE